MAAPLTRIGVAGGVTLAAAALVAFAPEPAYDPLAVAAAAGPPANREATIPPACYRTTEGEANTCWTCHTDSRPPNAAADWDLQAEYTFSDAARKNPWTNAFVDRRAAVSAIGDEEILAWIRGDNLGPLRRALEGRTAYPGYVPDLDLARGFDEQGFARDGSGWRAYLYQPFPGFWPGDGSAGDAMIRLPPAFRRDASGADSRAVYVANLALLEAAFAAEPGALPAHYQGGAAAVPVERHVFPAGTELLHTVRYLDPDRPGLLSRRLKELRFMKKVARLDGWAMLRAYEREQEERDEGALPRFAGGPEVGLLNAFGWQLQGYIEDARGRLRLQTEEEHLFCMGCHSSLGVTVDQTFSFARKVPGPAGWRHQDAGALRDRPQLGHARPELETWLARAGRSIDEAAALRTPSRRRALDLDKAYLTIVRAQSFRRGREVGPAPAEDRLRRVEGERTGLRPLLDGTAWLDWR